MLFTTCLHLRHIILSPFVFTCYVNQDVKTSWFMLFTTCFTKTCSNYNLDSLMDQQHCRDLVYNTNMYIKLKSIYIYS